MATGGVKKFNELFLYPKGRKTFMQKTLDTLFDRSEGKKFAKTSSARISVIFKFYTNFKTWVVLLKFLN